MFNLSQHKVLGDFEELIQKKIGSEKSQIYPQQSTTSSHFKKKKETDDIHNIVIEIVKIVRFVFRSFIGCSPMRAIPASGFETRSCEVHCRRHVNCQWSCYLSQPTRNR